MKQNINIKTTRQNRDEVEKFVLKVIAENKKRSQYKGFNPVFTGLNDFLRSKGYNPVEIYEKMQQKGLIRIRPMQSRNGRSFVLLYLPEDFKQRDFSMFEKLWGK